MPRAKRLSYDLVLPVYKQGTDLAMLLEHHSDPAKAVLAQAAAYEEAAAVMRRLATLLQSQHGRKLTVDADTHCITVTGPENMLKGHPDLSPVPGSEDSDG